MKKILMSALMLLCGVGLFTSCDSDRDDNPTLQSPTTFVLNTPAIAGNTLDIASSSKLVLTCSQPDYGYPAYTAYVAEVSLTEDFNDYEALPAQNSARLELDGNNVAVALTNLVLRANPEMTEEDFPVDIPVYIRVHASQLTYGGTALEGTSIYSNTIKLQNVHLEFSLPPVEAPAQLNLVGGFCGNDWNKAVAMIEVNGSRAEDQTTATFWRMIWIDDQTGVKFNVEKAFDGNEIGFDGINIEGGLADQIEAGNDGYIKAKTAGWFLMAVKATVNGRDLIYDVTFNEPEVWLIGKATPTGEWNELMEGCKFEVPTTADGEFKSPALKATPGTEDGGCVRAYVKVPGWDWWRSEFMVFDGKLVYRGTGGDQDRVGSKEGEFLFLNFGNDTGRIADK